MPAGGRTTQPQQPLHCGPAGRLIQRNLKLRLGSALRSVRSRLKVSGCLRKDRFETKTWSCGYDAPCAVDVTTAPTASVPRWLSPGRTVQLAPSAPCRHPDDRGSSRGAGGLLHTGATTPLFRLLFHCYARPATGARHLRGAFKSDSPRYAPMCIV